jgi:hypothetical protein
VALYPDLRDQWLTCESWASAINTRTSDGINVEVNSGTISSSLSRDLEFSTYSERYKTGDNDTGYFKVVWDHTQIYYVYDAGDSIECPKLTASWYAAVMKNQHIAAVTVADEDADGSIAVPNRNRTKRRKTSGPDILQLTIDELRKQSYFDSTEAEMLFNPTEDETVSMLSTDESNSGKVFMKGCTDSKTWSLEIATTMSILSIINVDSNNKL